MANQRQNACAYAVHLYTASGIIFVFLALIELFAAAPDPRVVFLWLIVAVIVDATDGPLARKFDTKKNAARISGRTIDELVDYLSFTFVPLVLVWRMGWLSPLPVPSSVLVVMAMFVSLFGFANTSAKSEKEGFFLGFPSYWNIYAFYAGISYYNFGPWPAAILLLILTIVTLTPLRFIYPNLAPEPWRKPMLIGSVIWLLILFALIPDYPAGSNWLLILSTIYPLVYVILSVLLDMRLRKQSVEPD